MIITKAAEDAFKIWLKLKGLDTLVYPEHESNLVKRETAEKIFNSGWEARGEDDKLVTKK